MGDGETCGVARDGDRREPRAVRIEAGGRRVDDRQRNARSRGRREMCLTTIGAMPRSEEADERRVEQTRLLDPLSFRRRLSL